MHGADAEIAVLIPVLNEAQRIGPLIDDLIGLRFSEIVVCDGGSADTTAQTAASRGGVRVIVSRRGRGAQLGAAMSGSYAPVVLMLHADTRLPRSAAALIRSALADPAVVGGCFRLRFDNDHALFGLYGWFTRFESSFTSFGDQAFFARRDAIGAIGGIPDWPLLEDVELRRRLCRHGRFVKIAAEVTTSARRFERRGVVLTQLVNMLIVAGYWFGLSPRWLAARYGAEKQ